MEKRLGLQAFRWVDVLDSPSVPDCRWIRLRISDMHNWTDYARTPGIPLPQQLAVAAPAKILRHHRLM